MGLDDNTKKTFTKIVFSHLKPSEAKVFIFGSRATGKNRKYSDVDLGILSKSEIPVTTKFDLEEEFDQSDLPYRVDIVDFSKVSDKFKEVAMRNIIYL